MFTTNLPFSDHPPSLSPSQAEMGTIKSLWGLNIIQGPQETFLHPPNVGEADLNP